MIEAGKQALEEIDRSTSTPDTGTTNEATKEEGTKMTSKRNTTGSHKAVSVKQQIRSSDWLAKNTPELSAGQDPELFKDLLDRARK
ncbi:unnamed protein product [Coregonus sp. 'balchen']|nr:unnamed protein product [Coregonus sp. 'balchen']